VKVLKHRDRVDAAGTAVFVVHDDAQRVRDWMLRDLDMPYPVLVDTEMSSYKAWGLGWAGKLSALGPRMVLGYARKLLFEGERLHMGSEPLQLGGDFVVGPDGRLSYAHPQTAVDDRPPVGLLVRELQRAAPGPA
jgi:AhpC/TSA antioxidant enzyme